MILVSLGLQEGALLCGALQNISTNSASSLIRLTHRNRYLLSRASQLRKGFAKLRGRTTDDSLKRAIEVRHGLKSAGEGNFANSRMGMEQKRLRFLHWNSRGVIDEIHPVRLLKHLAELRPSDLSV